MKLVLFIAILLVKTVLSQKVIWNGKNADVTDCELYIYSKYMEANTGKRVKLGNDRHYLKDEMNVFPHVTFVNIQIYPIEGSKYVENGKGIVIDYFSFLGYQIFFRPSPYNEYLLDHGSGSCFITYCSLGLYLYHEESGADDIIEDKITDFNSVFYLKLTMKTGEYLIGTFKGAGYNVHLILCPYDNWVSPKSMVKFIPYKRGGIEVDNFWNMHILLPTYGKDANEGKLLCGYLKYLDGDTLKIGFKLDFLKSKKDIKIRKINVRSDELVCSDGMKETHYYHIGYSDKSKEITSNRYINTKYLDRKALFHEEKIYLYNKLENELKNLLKDGPKIYETNDEYVYPSIEPSCKLEINPIPGKLTLHGSDNSRINLNNSSSGVEILYMEEDLLEERTKLKCVIETEDEGSKYNLKNFYNNTFKAELVSIDEKGNVKTVSQINFGESYGKYGCILKPRSGDKLHEDSKFIKPLYFETRYNEDSDSKREWKNVNEMSIECRKENSFRYGIWLISIIGVIAVSTIVIVVIVVVVLERGKRSKIYEVILLKDRKDKSSKGRSTSSSFKNSSSSSGDSKYLSKLKESRKIRKY
uniref:6-cysteine protein n=1 Tax=Parastrongyloides trichosuri TaxID=131310 RepID=A0A0N4ZTY3_PARTI